MPLLFVARSSDTHGRDVERYFSGAARNPIVIAKDEPDNVASIAAHVALGFKDEGLVRCCKKI